MQPLTHKEELFNRGTALGWSVGKPKTFINLELLDTELYYCKDHIEGLIIDVKNGSLSGLKATHLQ